MPIIIYTVDLNAQITNVQFKVNFVKGHGKKTK